MSAPYTADPLVLSKQLGTDPKSGLSQDEVASRLLKYGENRLKEGKKKTNLQRFADQFKDAMIIILLVAATVSFIVACTGHDPSEFFEPALILIIVILNAVIGVLQENRAQQALDALKNLSAPHARVTRGGQQAIIAADQLVPGDIISLEAGDFVPADARLISSAALKSDESALTGESVPAEKDASAIAAKDAAVGDRINMVFSGCSITYGHAAAIVTGTGMNTEMGKIADLLDSHAETQTPLQKKLAGLGKNLGFLALAACAVIFIIGLIDGLNVLELFMTSVSLAVSAIPEGLPAIVTVVLSIGVTRMVKKNAIIRRLPAVETLGSASVICSDKTGTLTQNRMTLVKAHPDGGETEDITDSNSEAVRKLLAYGTLCCDGSVSFTDEGEVLIGDPTETSIISAAHKNGLSQSDLNSRYPRLAEIPFDSDRKRMTTVNKIDGKNIVIVKGALDSLLPVCVNGDLSTAADINEQMSESALRVITIAYKEIESIPETPTIEALESDLTLLGLVGMVDPPRPEAKTAVKICKQAGIRPVMITGDHVVTASAIARELGILSEGGKAVTGSELSKMSEDELNRDVENISVYARVSPEDKIRIVKAWQARGEIVSMTGDGVNDAPALKAADIGCAMGITGTDVAKGAADMTLTDDNFSTIVDAVKEGRGIYENIKKVVGFLLGTNIGEVLLVFISMLVWKQSPLLSMQLLFINLVTDSTPAIALGMEPVEEGIMDKKPKPKDEGIFAHGLGLRVALQGCMFAVLSMIGFVIGLNTLGIQAGRTMAFMILSTSQVLHAYNMRSNRSLFKIRPFSNKPLNLSVLLSLALTALVIFTPLANIFGLTFLHAWMYLSALGLAFVPIPVMEIAKALKLVK